MKQLIQYRGTVYLTEELAQAWDRYKHDHPEHSFNGIMLQLLKEKLLCVIAART